MKTQHVYVPQSHFFYLCPPRQLDDYRTSSPAPSGFQTPRSIRRRTNPTPKFATGGGQPRSRGSHSDGYTISITGKLPRIPFQVTKTLPVKEIPDEREMSSQPPLKLRIAT